MRLLLGAVLAAGGLAAWSSVDGGPAPAPSVPEIDAASVVRVVVTPETGPVELATGFVLRPGRVVTVAHVLNRGEDVVVRAADGTRRQARVLRIDRRDDLALLAVAGGPASSEGVSGPAGDGTRLLVHRGGDVRALPAGLRRNLTARVHSPSDGTTYGRPALELSATVRVGDSGAPVVGAGGRVLGILFASSRTGTAKAYAVDSKVIPALLRDGSAGGHR